MTAPDAPAHATAPETAALIAASEIAALMAAPEIAAMLAHHEELQSFLHRRVEALSATVEAGEPFERERQAVHAFISSEVVPHALAEEDSVYRVGSARAALKPLVDGMVMEHEALVALAGRLAESSEPVATAATAASFLALFEAHVRKENELLLPLLLADGAKPADLLADMHHAFEHRRAAAEERVLDTREHQAGSCASLATKAFDDLEAGHSFVLIADHDPRGIHYMLDAERPHAAAWQVLEDGPDRWKARISKVS